MARAKVVRTVRLVRPPGGDAGGVGILQITVGKKSQFYAFAEIPCAIGGRGFHLRRLGGTAVYAVRVGRPVNCSCECLGWLSRGNCKHVHGLRALTRRGQL